MRCFDSSTQVTEPRRFGLTHYLRISIFDPMLATGQEFKTVFERAGDRRCA